MVRKSLSLQKLRRNVKRKTRFAASCRSILDEETRLTCSLPSKQDSGRSKKKSKPPKVPIERKNTAVYVTSLPHDVTLDEVHQVFSRCGVIAEEIDSGQPRIKLYQSEDGKFKGDALIVYFRAESVRLAIQMLDDTDFRLGEQVISGKMTVKEADFSYKKVQDKTTAQKTGTTKDQKKIMQKTQKLNR